MKTRTPERIYVYILLVIFAGIVVHAPLSVGFGILFPDQALLIKSWKEILLAIASAIGIIMVSQRGMWRELARDWVFRIIAAYGALHLLLIGFMNQGAQSVAAGLAIDLRYIVFFVLCYVLVRLNPAYRRKMLIVAGVGAGVVIGFGVLQLFLPADILSHIGYSRNTIAPYLTVDKNPDYIRINSTLRGPNPLGAYAVIVLGMVASFVVLRWNNIIENSRKFTAVVLGIAAAVVLWVSYSRSALVAGLVAVGLVILIVKFRQIRPRSWIISLAIIGALAGGLIVQRGSDIVSNVILHENQNGGSRVSSNDDHISSLAEGTAKALEQPLGGGIGSTGSASLLGDDGLIVENQYLFIAHESGWLGVVLFFALYLLILQRLWRQRKEWVSLGLLASGVGLALIGLLLPVWADDTVALIWWGLAGMSFAAKSSNKRRQS